MKKTDFLRKLSWELRGVRTEEKKRFLSYYDEMIEDSIENGKEEEETIAALGSPASVAAQILMEEPNTRKPKRSAGSIALIILGSPLWLALLIAFGAVLLAIYICLWAVAIALISAVIGILVAGVAGMITCILYLGVNTGGAVLFLGGGLICIGVSILLFVPALQLARATALLAKKAVLGLRNRAMDKVGEKL